jgi:hypothetical protein
MENVKLEMGHVERESHLPLYPTLYRIDVKLG